MPLHTKMRFFIELFLVNMIKFTFSCVFEIEICEIFEIFNRKVYFFL